MLFAVRAFADPQTLPRVIGYFAQIAVIPTAVAARWTGERMSVRIQAGDLSSLQARIIAEKMRGLALVVAVRLYPGGTPPCKGSNTLS